MNNIILLEANRGLLQQTEQSRAASVTHLVVNTFDDNLYTASGTVIYCHSSHSLQEIWSLDLASSNLQEEPKVVALAYLVEHDGLFTALSSGELLLVYSGEVPEEVGTFEGGICAAAWSVGEDLLAVVTSLGGLLTMNKDWQIVAEVPSIADAAGCSGIGLGVERASISWQGNESCFTTYIRVGGRNMVCTWLTDTEGGCVLHSSAVDTDSLTGCISWQPNGRTLCAAADTDGFGGIALYERNGLPHGSFPLRSQGTVTSLQWSADSKYLALVLASPAKDAVTLVQVWQRTNWHWHVKYEEQCPCEHTHVAWEASAINIVTGDGEFRKVVLTEDMTVSPAGTAAVVDGSKVRLTPLSRQLYPPPLSATAATFSCSVAAVAMYSMADAESLAALLSDQTVAIVKSSGQVFEELTEMEVSTDAEPEACHSALPCRFREPLAPEEWIRSLLWLGEDALLAVVSPSLSNGNEKPCDVLVEFQLGRTDGSYAAEQTGAVPLDGQVRQIATALGGAVLQLQSGAMLHYSRGGAVAGVAGQAAPPVVCDKILAVVGANGGLAVAGLTARGQLYVGSELAAERVTSVALCSQGSLGQYLLFTTAEPSAALDMLHIRQLGQAAGTSAPKQFSTPADRPGPRGARLAVRAVEQGAVLVAAPPGGVQVVLQMPRGNLEAVRPRLLVLAAICAALDEHRYEAAWELTTVNRVNMNVVVDHRWPVFLQQARDFVTQIQDEHDLNDLLSSLQPSSVFGVGGVYEEFKAPPSELTAEAGAGGEGEELGGKVERVSIALRQAMQDVNAARYLKPLLTSYAVNGDLQGALALLKEVKEAELAGDAAAGSAAEQGVKHLLLTVDVNKLYRAALESYSLELAYMVVACSQSDPGEALLELQGFAAVAAGPLRRAAIDRHFRSWAGALRNLMEAGEPHFEEALQLAQEQELLRELVGLCKASPALRRRALLAHGEHLLRRSMAEDAAVAFAAAGALAEALAAYRQAGQWRMAFTMAGMLGWDEAAVRELAGQQVEHLRAWGRPGDAGQVAAEYLADADLATSLLAEAQEWRTALQLAYRFGRPDLVDTVVFPAAAEASAGALGELREVRERQAKYFERLQQVHERRAAMKSLLEEAEAGAPRALDAESDVDAASSLADKLSAYAGDSVTSNASSTTAPLTAGGRKPQKNKRKKKKGPNIRAGGPDEEESLAEHLLSLRPSDQKCREVGQLTELLVIKGHEEDAALLQRLLSEILEQHEKVTAYVKDQLPTLEAQSAEKRAAQKKSQATQWKWDLLR